MNKSFDKDKTLNDVDKRILYFLVNWIQINLSQRNPKHVHKSYTLNCIKANIPFKMKLIFNLFEEENIEFFEEIIQKYMHDDFMFLYQYNIIVY